MTRRAVVAVVAAAGALMLTTTPSWAGNGFAMAVDVRNSSETVIDSNSGSCTWRVSSEVTLINLTDQTLTIDAVRSSVSWTGPGGTSGVQNEITMPERGGLDPGTSLAPHETRRFAPVVDEFAIPCAADTGDLAVLVTTARGTSSGDAPFLENGTPVPLRAAGGLALAGVVGIAFTAAQRRRRTTAAV